MQVDFKIVSYHRLSPEQISEFSVKENAVFGRSNTSDWCLPDPEKVVSGSHLKIEKETDGFYLYDTSTNGVFINRSVEPLGRSSKHHLQNGDLLSVGDYEITAEINGEIQNVSVLDSIDPESVALNNVQIPEPIPNEPIEFLVKDLLSEDKLTALPSINNDLNDNFIAPKSKSTAAIPEEWDLNLLDDAEPVTVNEAPTVIKAEELEAATPVAVGIPEVAVSKVDIPDIELDDLPTPIPTPVSTPIPTTREEVVNIKPIVKPVELPPKQAMKVEQEVASVYQTSVPAHKSTPINSANGDLSIFLKGLGLSDKINTDLISEQVMFELGQSMNLMFMGLIKLLRNRASLKSEFKINQTTFQPQENNPLKFSATIDDVFNNLYLQGGSSFLSSQKAIKSAFSDTEKHDQALSAGTMGALLGVLDQLDPELIKGKNIQDHYFDKLIPANKYARNWDLYTQLHDDLKNDISTHGSGALTDDFVKAYDDKIKNL